jgi:hypothetical protein
MNRIIAGRNGGMRAYAFQATTQLFGSLTSQLEDKNRPAQLLRKSKPPKKVIAMQHKLAFKEAGCAFHPRPASAGA